MTTMMTMGLSTNIKAVAYYYCFACVFLMLGIHLDFVKHVESFTYPAGCFSRKAAGSIGTDDRSSAYSPWLSSSTCLFGKKKKTGGGGGGYSSQQQPQQEKKSVKEARFDANTRQFMFTLSRLTKILPDKSKKILDDIDLSFYPGAKIGVVGLNGSGYVFCCASLSLNLVSRSTWQILLPGITQMSFPLCHRCC
jgi:ABC-type multidrug transport system fused ATPase/permease subunit